MSEVITSLYVTRSGMSRLERQAFRVEDEIGAELGFGGDFVNVYSADPRVVDTLIEIIGPREVDEVAPLRRGMTHGRFPSRRHERRTK